MIGVETLRGFKIFHDAPAASLQQLAGQMSEASFKQGDTICKEGDSGGALYLIASGSVSIEKKAFQEESGNKIVARLEAGDFFGEMAFLQGVAHSATVVAQEDSKILSLSRSALDGLIVKEPKTALDQVLTVSMGLSNRLRSTTRELVSVYLAARAVGAALSLEELGAKVMGQLSQDFGESVTVALYRWNMFNDEHALVCGMGPLKEKLPSTIEKIDSVKMGDGQLVTSPIQMLGVVEGLCLYYAEKQNVFTAGEKQLIETISAVLAPAMVTARHREEEILKQRLANNKQRYSL